MLAHGFSSDSMEQRNNEQLFIRKGSSEKEERLQVQWDDSRLQMQNEVLKRKLEEFKMDHTILKMNRKDAI